MPSRTSIPDHRLTLRNKTRQCAGKSCSTNAQAILPTSCTDADDGRTSQDHPPRGILPVCPELALFPLHLRTVQSPIATLAAWFTAIRHTELVHQWRACDLACCSPRSGKLEPMLAHAKSWNCAMHIVAYSMENLTQISLSEMNG